MQESEVLSLPKRKRGDRDFEDLLCSNMSTCCRDSYKTDSKSDFHGFNAQLFWYSHALGNTDVSEGGYFWLSVGISCSRSGGLLVISC